jgi:hypothetical protein
MFGILFLMIPFVVAVRPSPLIVNSGGLDISYPNTYYLKLDQNLSIRFWVYNVSNGAVITNATTNCTFNLLDKSGKNVLRLSSPASSGIQFGNLGANACANCFNFEIAGGNFSYKGYYEYQIRCQTIGGSNYGGYTYGSYETTQTGLEPTQACIIIFFMIIFIILIGSSCYLALYSLGHLMRLDFDLTDLSINWGIYFILIVVTMFETTYLNSPTINTYLTWFLGVDGVLLVFIPIIAFIFSIIIGSINKKEINAGSPPQLWRRR